MNKILKTIVCASALALAASCKPEELTTRYPNPGEEFAWTDLPLTIRTGDEEETKASLLRDVESQGSGALVLVFRTATGLLDSYRFFTQAELQNQASVPLKLRVPLTECDFYILGNLNGIRKSDGTAVNLKDALGADFPTDETTLEGLVYRLDGGDLNSAYRRERFSDVASLGIPYLHISKALNTTSLVQGGQGLPGSDKCRRLFSKVTVRIDHAAFDGSGANPNYFVNRKLYLRAANARLQPFSETSQRAVEAADVLAQSDYDPDMSATNASVTTFSFYVPENMQGNLLQGNTDSRKKTRDELLAQGKSAVEPYLTYVEFSGDLNAAAGGYGGAVTYRFYPGRDNCANFDLERGREYVIQLTFRVGSLFEPDWKVSLDSWTDTRLFCLTADPAFTDPLPDAKTVAVRKHRNGVFYLYMNPSGSSGGANSLVGKDTSTSASYVPSSLSDCSWYADFLSSSSADAAWLSARGIQAVWEKGSARLCFSVVDEALFDSHLGESRVFTLKLLPNGTQTRVTLKLQEDIIVTVADGKSLTEDFYLGQKRTLTVTGLAGGTVYYAADQDPCGSSATGARHTANRQWKTVNTGDLSSGFPFAKVDAAGNLALTPSLYTSQALSGNTLNIYAFYPNRFQECHSGWTSRSGKIIFFTQDYLNDSVEVDLCISEPLATQPDGYSGYTYLPLDGNEVEVPAVGYKSVSGTYLPESGFDSTLYDALLKWRVEADSAPFLDCVTYDAAQNCMYVSRTQTGDGKLEELAYNDKGTYSTGKRIRVYTNDATGLFRSHPGLSSGIILSRQICFTKLAIQAFSADGGVHWGSDPSAAVFSVAYCRTGNNTVNQLVDDESFSIWVKYIGRNYDWSRVEMSRTGSATEYTTPYGLKYGPILELVEDTPDTGRGGTVRWLYDESHQVMRSTRGEFVPGGLLLPYGPQTVSFRCENKWDHRTITSESSALTLNYSTPFGYFIGATRTRNASVYIIPWKCQKYLKRIDSTVNRSGRQFMTSFLGTTSWYQYFKYSHMYGKVISGRTVHDGVGYWGDYFWLKDSSDSGMALPRTDYDVKYVDGYSSASVWSQAALNAVLTACGSASWSGLSDSSQGSAHMNLLVTNTHSVTPSYESGKPWGPYIVSNNAAYHESVAGVFLDVNEAF